MAFHIHFGKQAFYLRVSTADERYYKTSSRTYIREFKLQKVICQLKYTAVPTRSTDQSLAKTINTKIFKITARNYRNALDYFVFKRIVSLTNVTSKRRLPDKLLLLFTTPN